MIERRWHSSVLGVRSFRGADCDTDHYLVVAKLRERLAVHKQAAQKFEGERFNVRKLNELEVKEKYQIEITNRFAALENLTLCRSYLKPYCMGRKTAFFQRAFKFTYYTRNRSPLQEKKIITIKLKKTER